MNADPELRALLVAELERHLCVLEDRPRELEEARRAVHAMKGAAGLAAELDLASSLQRLERRLRDGDESAVEASAALVRGAAARLARGESGLGVTWPEPPADLRASTIDPDLRAHYDAELRDQLAGIDRVLAAASPTASDARALHRHVHTIKGGASSVGDDAMAWFCHGLEERLGISSPTDAAAARVLEEAAKWRDVLSIFAHDTDSALAVLRSGAAPRAPARPSAPDDVPTDATIRVSTGSVDRLLDRFVAIDLVRERLASRIDVAREHTRELRRLRGDLADALRLIGPPRPWGAPAAALRRIEWTATSLSALGDELDQSAQDLLGGDQVLKDSVDEARQELAEMRLTPLTRLFSRLSAAITTESRRLGRPVIVRTEGAGETIDRRVADLLVEPCYQLVRNAVAHGIEPGAVRVASGKAEAGTVSLVATKQAGHLTITIEDDGGGVDMDRVRTRAVELGVISRAVADAADDGTLLSLLFLPGFTTRSTSDMLAGRGVGMDIALSGVQRAGGVIRLSNRARAGLSAKIELPVGTGLVTVLWVAAGGQQYALPVSRTRVVHQVVDEDRRAPHLASCLDLRASERATHTVELDDEASGASLRVGVDEVGRTEDVLVRPLSPLVAGIGPFAGVIVRGDGSLRMALDVYALAPRARTVARLPEVTAGPPSSGLVRAS